MRTSHVPTHDVTKEAYFTCAAEWGTATLFEVWITQPSCCASEWKQHTETPCLMCILYNCVFCLSIHKVTVIGNVFTVRKIVQELLFCCGGTHITEWSVCFFRCFLIMLFEMEVSLPGHKVHQTSCHQSYFCGYLWRVICAKRLQNAVDIEMHYKCSYTKYCWICRTALGRRLSGILMPAKQQNVNAWNCAKYGCELGKISDHSNQWWSGFFV